MPTKEYPPCQKCGKSFNGLNACHCTSCHESFRSANAFDRHRAKFQCIEPSQVKLIRYDDGMWGFPSWSDMPLVTVASGVGGTKAGS